MFVYLVAFVSMILFTATNGAEQMPNQVAPAVVPNVKQDTQTSMSFHILLKGFSATLYVIIISELGDKTFFIAAIMSMQYSRMIVYLGAMAALATMTILSAFLGYATTVIPRSVTYYSSGVLFVLFGLKMLYDAYKMSADDVKEEYEEVRQQLANSVDIESGNVAAIPRSSTTRKIRHTLRHLFSPVLAEAFVLTFLAEWGDRSQITTIILAATYNVYGVIIGGILGHAICTGLAVLVGRFIAQRIPVKHLTYIGGVTFLIFAALTFLGNPDSNS